MFTESQNYNWTSPLFLFLFCFFSHGVSFILFGPPIAPLSLSLSYIHLQTLHSYLYIYLYIIHAVTYSNISYFNLSIFLVAVEQDKVIKGSFDRFRHGWRDCCGDQVLNPSSFMPFFLFVPNFLIDFLWIILFFLYGLFMNHDCFTYLLMFLENTNV